MDWILQNRNELGAYTAEEFVNYNGETYVFQEEHKTVGGEKLTELTLRDMARSVLAATIYDRDGITDIETERYHGFIFDDIAKSNDVDDFLEFTDLEAEDTAEIYRKMKQK